VLTDHLASALNRSSAPPPLFPTARFASLWRSHPVSFFRTVAPKTYAPAHCHALDAAPYHLVADHGQIWPGHHRCAMGCELPCFARGQLAHG
jgi:hypothetical protein